MSRITVILAKSSSPAAGHDYNWGLPAFDDTKTLVGFYLMDVNNEIVFWPACVFSDLLPVDLALALPGCALEETASLLVFHESGDVENSGRRLVAIGDAETLQTDRSPADGAFVALREKGIKQVVVQAKGHFGYAGVLTKLK